MSLIKARHNSVLTASKSVFAILKSNGYKVRLLVECWKDET